MGQIFFARKTYKLNVKDKKKTYFLYKKKTKTRKKRKPWREEKKCQGIEVRRCSKMMKGKEIKVKSEKNEYKN